MASCWNGDDAHSIWRNNTGSRSAIACWRESLQKLTNSLITGLRVLFEATHDDAFDRRSKFFSQTKLAQSNRLFIGMLPHRLEAIFADERWLPTQHFIEEAAERIDVSAHIYFASHHLLRTHIQRAAEHFAGFR